MAGKQHRKKSDNLPSSKDVENIPVSITEDKDKLELWKYLVADLKDRKIYSSTFTFIVTDTVNTVWLLHKLENDLHTQGSLVDRHNRDGDVVGQMTNPLFDQVMKLKAHMQKLIEKLGMSPRDIAFLIPGDGPSPAEITAAEQAGGSNTKRIVYFAD